MHPFDNVFQGGNTGQLGHILAVPTWRGGDFTFPFLFRLFVFICLILVSMTMITDTKVSFLHVVTVQMKNVPLERW